MGRIREAWDDHFREHGVVGGILLLPVLLAASLYIAWMMFWGVLFGLGTAAALFLVPLALGVIAVVAGSKQVVSHPGAEESVGLELLVLSAVVVGAILLRHQVREWQLPEGEARATASRWQAAVGMSALAAGLAGIVIFLNGVHVTEPRSTAGDSVNSSAHSSDGSFCEQHQCIGNFTSEPGTIVECGDGTFSHAGGIQGACSDHEGVARE